MGKTVPYYEHAICDICGKEGALDFMGDCYCYDCLEKFRDDEEECIKGNFE